MNIAGESTSSWGTAMCNNSSFTGLHAPQFFNSPTTLAMDLPLSSHPFFFFSSCVYFFLSHTHKHTPFLQPPHSPDGLAAPTLTPPHKFTPPPPPPLPLREQHSLSRSNSPTTTIRKRKKKHHGAHTHTSSNTSPLSIHRHMHTYSTPTHKHADTEDLVQRFLLLQHNG